MNQSDKNRPGDTHLPAPFSAPTSSNSDFDALGYAQLSAQAAQAAAAEIQAAINDVSPISCGATDPYVDLSESEGGMTPTPNYEPSGNMDSPMDPQETIAHTIVNASISRIEELQEAIESFETQSVGPVEVEVIDSNTPKAELVNPVIETPLDVPASWIEQATEEVPVSFFVLEKEKAPVAESESPTVQPLPVVPAVSGEPVYDVRDFVEAANREVEAVRGGFEVDPEAFDYKVGEQLSPGDPVLIAGASLKPVVAPPVPSTESSSQKTNIPVAKPTEAVAGKVFVANVDDVITINGKDGYDHIDLACFDVAHAAFFDQMIKIDNKQGFTVCVQYTDIDYALFTDGVKVRLK